MNYQMKNLVWDYDQLGSGEKEWVRDEIDNMSMNESDSNYPDFDLNKNIRYQDTSISRRNVEIYR